MLLNGTLSKKNDKWIVVEDDNEYWYPHRQHNLWLLVHGYEGMKVCFQLEETTEYAILKACSPDTREYVQD